MEKVKYSLNAEVSIVEQTDRIKQVAEKIGIILPSTHTAIFASRYSGIEVANGNGIRLAKDAVEKSIQGLIGAQVNLEHTDIVCGIILDAWIDEKANDIKIIFTMAKNIFQKEYYRALERLSEGKLSVSFELLSNMDSADQLADGTVRLNDIDFQGVGFLIEKDPADKYAKIFEFASDIRSKAQICEKEFVFASKIIDSCNKVLSDNPMEVTDDPEMDCNCPYCHMPMSADSIVYDPEMNMFHKPCMEKGRIRKPWYIHSTTGFISTTSSTSTSTNIEVGCNNEEFNQSNQGGKVMTEEQKKMVADIRAQLAGYLPQDTKDEDLLDEAKVAEYRTIKEDAEKTKAEKEAQDKLEAEKAKEEKIAALEKEVSDLKVTIENQTKEIDAFKAEADARAAKEKAEKLAQIKAELKDNEFCKDFTDEDYFNDAKIKEAKILKENAILKAEVEALKKGEKEEVKAEKKDDLSTGHSEEKSEVSVSQIINKLGKK